MRAGHLKATTWRSEGSVFPEGILKKKLLYLTNYSCNLFFLCAIFYITCWYIIYIFFVYFRNIEFPHSSAFVVETNFYRNSSLIWSDFAIIFTCSTYTVTPTLSTEPTAYLCYKQYIKKSRWVIVLQKYPLFFWIGKSMFLKREDKTLYTRRLLNWSLIGTSWLYKIN